MRMLVTGKQMKAIDAYTIHTIGVPSLVLMERAALKVAQAAERLWKKGDTIWAVCGTGNNGADGVAAARMLHLKGYPVRVFLVGNPDKGTEEFRTQLTIAGNVGLSSLSAVCQLFQRSNKPLWAKLCQLVVQRTTGIFCSNRAGAVSYTHLDVYKRQPVRVRANRSRNNRGD